MTSNLQCQHFSGHDADAVWIHEHASHKGVPTWQSCHLPAYQLSLQQVIFLHKTFDQLKLAIKAAMTSLHNTAYH